MDLSIIIVSWNVRDQLAKNLKSIFASEGFRQSYEAEGYNLQVFLVDNNSSDRTAQMVARDFPRVKLIANKQNRGFAAANNQALGEAEGRYVLLLNPDMKLKPETLAKMVGWMDEHQEAAIAGCHLLDEEAKTVPSVRRFPDFWSQLAITLKLPHIMPGVLNRYLMKDFDYQTEARVDSVRGGFFMIRRETMAKLGQLDERYFLWFEEVDYCKRAAEAGLKVWYTPTAECYDYFGQSFKQLKRGKSQRIFRDSMLKYFRKWHSPAAAGLLTLAWIIMTPFLSLPDILGIKSKNRT